MPSSAVPSVSSSSLAQSSFRAPAHKHAHHLHSIPPREKSTRTLIIDHMLWVHARTRFSQARAELGMTDRTGGPKSPNYIHRARPELYEEEDEEGSEGEDVVPLKARAGGPGHPHDDEEHERQRYQDLSLARSLRLRAEGVEKVITSMLEQPPPIHPVEDEVVFTPPTSPNPHPHTLPNGVRLRLALGTIINDLFARQAPPPPYRHTHAPNSKIATPPDHSPSHVPSPSNLPHALTTLAPVSGAFAPLPQLALMPLPSPAYPSYASPYVNNPHPSFNQQSQMQYHQNMPPPPRRRPRPRSRTRRLYAVGADPSTANSPPSFRCPRHLHTGCEICVEAKSPTRQSGTSHSHRRSSSFGMDRNGASNNTWRAVPGGGIPGWSGGITGWQDGSGIGSGLLRPGVRGSALRRKAREPDSTAGAGNTKLSKLIPRFIRLSALVAAELGREARGEEEEVGDNGRDKDREGSLGPGVNPSTPGRNEPANWNAGAPPSPVTPRLQLQKRMYENALRPSLEWYMLLAGLLTRAVLEGYLTAGWSGLQAIQCLLLVGLGLNVNAGKRADDKEDAEEEDENDFADLDPDELPNLVDAIKVLFPALRDGGLSQKGKEEEEYEAEMLERLSRFYDIPASTPDCSTHMEDLAWQYPAEPVERSAVRFCEAIARWRGKPELETYKKKPIINPSVDTPGGGSVPVMTIDSLVHSNPSSPNVGNSSSEPSRRRRMLKRPSIDVYFLQSGPMQRRDSGSWNRGNKRYREDDGDGNQERSKRVYS
ncbi:hypothetical protein BYT27DRAFT_7104597 [Phlegmacium glaucopus]|nr:hypothetical protein BYT27DRAFT_7104597 [Phlegmacium glaucopus]